MTQVASLWCSVWLMIARWFQPNPSNINWLSWSIPKKSKQIGNVKFKIKIWNHQPVCAPHAIFPPSSIKICSCSVLSLRSFASPGPSSPCTSEAPKTSGVGCDESSNSRSTFWSMLTLQALPRMVDDEGNLYGFPAAFSLKNRQRNHHPSAPMAATGWNVATSHRSDHSSGSHPGREPRDQGTKGKLGWGFKMRWQSIQHLFCFRTKPSISFNLSWRW